MWPFKLFPPLPGLLPQLEGIGVRSPMPLGLLQGGQRPEHIRGLVGQQLRGVDVHQPVDERPGQGAALMAHLPTLLVELPAEAQLVERRNHVALAEVLAVPKLEG